MNSIELTDVEYKMMMEILIFHEAKLINELESLQGLIDNFQKQHHSQLLQKA